MICGWDGTGENFGKRRQEKRGRKEVVPGFRAESTEGGTSLVSVSPLDDVLGSSSK